MTVATSRRARARRELGSAAPLLALSGFAVAQPVLDVLGRNPELVVFRGASVLDLWLVGLAVVFGVPLVAWLVELAAGTVRRTARPHLHTVLVGVLGAALGAQVGARVLGLDGAPLALVAVATGVALAAFERRPLGRLWFSYAAWAPLVFLVLFAATSSSASAVRGSGNVAGVTVTDPARVVLVVLDELPLASLLATDGTIDADLYPGFAELADASHWFRAASAVSNATVEAVPSLLTGRHPRAGASPMVADHPDNLFTLLGGSYEMDVAEALTRLCPAAVCGDAGGVGTRAVGALLGDAARLWQEQVELRDTADPLAAFVEPAGEAHGGGWEDLGLEQPERFRDLLASVGEAPARTLHYAHLLLPHTPSRYLASGRTYPHPVADRGPLWEEPGRFFDLWTTDTWPVQVGRQRAVLQTQYVDRLVQTLVAELRDAGVWDDSLVVVTSDHGRAFRPGEPARALAPGVDPTAMLPEVMGVPLFVKEPGQPSGQVHDGNVQLVDVLPTIADVLGVEIPWEVDGTSALAPGPRPDEKVLHQQLLDADLSARPGETFTVPAEGFFGRVVARGVHTLAAPSGALRVHRTGPGSTLVGTKVDEARVGRVAEATGRLPGLAAFDDVDPSSGSLPVFVAGEVDGADGAAVAVSVNGTIAGVAELFEWGGRSAVFMVLVPEELLVAGGNDVELYLVDDPASPVLRPVALAR